MTNNNEITPKNIEDGNDLDVAEKTRVRFKRAAKAWEKTPKLIRKIIVGVVGTTLLIFGGLLVVLPGPFTIPLVMAGLLVLASEFTWAAGLVQRSQRALGSVKKRLGR
jgi:hypothetical protein